ncbi:MAG: S-adenosylmethionine:tRNA ribosyltransferase-isomerase [Ferruginibacter sp.]|nr:S-adenosylmethionine:tRNA ribosyltransferase-isomerase [Ferruginibacter sp.]
MHPKEIAIHNFTYSLPDERIAGFPLSERDASKLLIYKEGIIKEDIYKNITGYLPEKSMLVFNNTRVIQARILFQKPTGGIIEIFCLEPCEAIKEYSSIMARKGKLCWKCLIGGAGKWKEGPLQKKMTVDGQQLLLTAQLIEKLPDAYLVELCWQPENYSFAEIIEQVGRTPLPPYIKRKAQQVDKERYQTIYAKYDGSVAAPTAGLHFTPAIFSALEAKSISHTYITLHVGAGTFKPVKSATLAEHEMHAEWIEVNADAINQLIENIANGIIAVGTTSLRTLESLYWMGVKTILYPGITMDQLSIAQWEIYEPPLAIANILSTAALPALLEWMHRNNFEKIITQTKLLIVPGYLYRMPVAVITNFHQPQSTLLLLVAAAIGEDWRRIYNYAMENDFRFLSYGDGSLIYLPTPAGQ